MAARLAGPPPGAPVQPAAPKPITVMGWRSGVEVIGNPLFTNC
jgi:hypothetical protein